MRRKAARAAQPSLFDTTHEGSRTLPTSVEAAVCCDAEVAMASDRMVAAGIDFVVPMAGFALFFAGFYWTAGGVTPGMKMLPWFGAALGMLMLLYRLTWCVAGFDTPGMQAANLRLISLDGRRPTRWARLCRMVGGMVSLLSLGIGLLWGLLDEERLTWHDHMSSTFPTRRY